MKKLGFIGLGIMGFPMAKNLIERSGQSLRAYDISKDAMARLCSASSKVIECSSPADVARDCDIVFVMLPDGRHVQTVVYGENGVLETASKGTIVVDMSSISPNVSKEIGAKCKEKGVAFIDTPVSGGEIKAIDGTLTFMAGGEESDFELVLPYIKHMGANATLVGPLGSGCAAKLVNQIVVNLNIATISEAVVLMKKLQLDPTKVISAISTGSAGSWIMDYKFPKMITRDFDQGGARIDINKKDIKNVLETSHEIGLSLPLTSQLYEIFHSLSCHGLDSWDHSAVVCYYENINNVK